jgi:hypothetical protein
MAGGFCPHNISPTAINELLRITKPGQRASNAVLSSAE